MSDSHFREHFRRLCVIHHPCPICDRGTRIVPPPAENIPLTIEEAYRRKREAEQEEEW